MIHKIKVQGTVGKGVTYLVFHDKSSNDLHIALTTKFSHELGTSVTIGYLQQWAVNEVSMNEVGKVDYVLVLD
jgi:hypothetical protein